MKTLKKILSVVLVVAMLASMLIVGAAAAETEKTNYEEAVAVVTGIGIIEGDENGMNFAGNVTREQAAKIISYLLLGEKTAEALKTTTAPFADVAATRWSAGYIAYLKGQGIISGVSDTEFDPTANVTGIAFAKMLLVAAGYGQNGEFEGKDWDINTITFANDTGIYTGTKTADVAAPATREEAMLYAFNLLTKVPVVKYNKTFESYYTGTSALDPVTGDVIPTNTTANDPYAYTLAWTKYDLKKVNVGVRDDFGRPAASWVAAGVNVTEALANVEPTAVLTGSVYSTTLYSTLGKTVISNLNEEGLANINIWVDGETKTGPLGGNPAVYGAAWGNIYAGEYTNQVSKTGANVELYLTQSVDNGDYTLDIVVWYEHLGEVKRVSTTGGVTTLTIQDIQGGTVTVTSEQVDVTGIAKKDMVIYTVGSENIADTVTSVAVVTPVVGTYSVYNEAYAAHVIDGAYVSTSAVGDNSAIDTCGNSYEIYYNTLGQILWAKDYDVAGATGSYSYVYVQGSQAVVKGEDLINNIDTKVAFDVVYPNGGQAVVYGAVKADSNGEYIMFNGSKIYVEDMVAESNPVTIAEGWYSFTTNDAGEITLKVLNGEYANTADSITISPAIATITGISGFTANKNTVLNVVNEDGTVISYTGINNFPAKTAGFADSVLYTYAKDSKVLKSVTIYVAGAPVTSTLNLAYCAGAWDSSETGASTDYTTYMFYVDGVMQFIQLDTAAESGCVYDLTVDDGEYTATKIGAYGAPAEADNDDNAATGTVNAGYTMFKVGAADKAYYADFNLTTLAFDYYEWATIDTIDENYFTTVAVDVEGYEEAFGAFLAAYSAMQADPENEDLIAAFNAANAAYAEVMADTVGGHNCEAHTYYFDNNTRVYDTTGMGATEISEGDVFVAYIDEAASVAYNGQMYASIIWIVG